MRPRPPWVAVAWPTAFAGAALLIAGCTTGGMGAAGSPKPPPASPPTAGAPSEPARAPEPPPAPPPPITPAMVQRTLTAAIELLEAGQEEPALAEIDKVLAVEPGNRLAQSLARQVREEPAALLGRESFSYRVAPGESLSLIAQRALGDRFMFYALARYNGIRVPRQLAGGQVIRVPGRSMPPAAAPPAERTPPPLPNPPPATIPTPPVAAPTPPPAPPPAPPPPDPARAERERAAAVARNVREARSAFARQDLEAAIAAWTRVLDIDPAHRTAAAERQRAIDLNERAKKLQPAR